MKLAKPARLFVFLGVAMGLAALAVTLAVRRPGPLSRPPTAPGAATNNAATTGATAGRQAFTIDPPTPAADFRLTDQHGRPFQLREQRGRAVLLFFGYTHCPDVCPTTLVTFKAVKEQLGGAASRVRFVFVTVDPERDTPERLREYVGYYDPDFVGLWGTPDQLKAVQSAYGVLAQKQPEPGAPGGYWVVHTAMTMLVDPQGNLRALYPFGTSAEEITADLRRLVG